MKETKNNLAVEDDIYVNLCPHEGISQKLYTVQLLVIILQLLRYIYVYHCH